MILNTSSLVKKTLLAIKYSVFIVTVYFFTAFFSIAQAGIAPTGSINFDVMLLVLFVVMAVGVSFTCSLAESTLLSMTPSYIADIKESEPKKSALLKKLKQDNIDQSLAAILTLNTIANTVGSIGAGIQANIVFGNQWMMVFTSLMTFAILVLSEIIPKTLGTVHWRKFSGFVAYFVQAISLVLFVIILLSNKLTSLLIKDSDKNQFSRREFTALASVGEESGDISPLESRIIRNLFAFGATKTEDIMTPRSVIFALKQTDTIAQVFAEHQKLGFSRIPIYDEDFDNITGFVLNSDLLTSKANDKFDKKISEHSNEINFVFSKMKLFDLLDMMIDDKKHMAIVVGEYGELKGLVSLEDILETLLGLEIIDEFDTHDDMQEHAKQIMQRRLNSFNNK